MYVPEPAYRIILGCLSGRCQFFPERRGILVPASITQQALLHARSRGSGCYMCIVIPAKAFIQAGKRALDFENNLRYIYIE